MVTSVVMSGLKVRTLMKSNGHASGIWENTVKIFVAMKEYDVWRIRTNQELMEVYREPDITSENKKRKSTIVRICG